MRIQFKIKLVISARIELIKGQLYTTHYAETFAVKNGGLLVADDFFTVDQQAYTDVLVTAVTAKISATASMQVMEIPKVLLIPL